MCHKFNSQGLGLKILELMVAGPKSGGFNPGSRVSGLKVSGLRSQGLGSQGPGSRVPGLRARGSRVPGPDFRLCPDMCVSRNKKCHFFGKFCLMKNPLQITKTLEVIPLIEVI